MTTPVISSPSAPAQVAAFESAFAALSAGPGSSDFASLLSTLTATSASDTAATGSAAAATGGSDVTGSDVVADAQKYLGIPYKWGGTTTAGFDCSGLTQHVFADLGISIPRTAAEQQAMPNAQHISSLADAQPGDLLFFGSPAHHVGIYVGNGQMLNAPHTGTDVRVEPVYETPTSILRVTGTSGAAAASASTGSSTAISGSLNVPSQYASDFLSAGAKYGISPTLLAAVAKAESGFNPSAVSPAGAIGIMQLMPGTAAGLGVDPHNAKQSIDGGAELLARDIKEFGSVSLGLAAYNAGPGAVSKYGGIPPYPETEAYVTKVMSLAGLPMRFPIITTDPPSSSLHVSGDDPTDSSGSTYSQVAATLQPGFDAQPGLQQQSADSPSSNPSGSATTTAPAPQPPAAPAPSDAPSDQDQTPQAVTPTPVAKKPQDDSDDDSSAPAAPTTSTAPVTAPVTVPAPAPTVTTPATDPATATAATDAAVTPVGATDSATAATASQTTTDAAATTQPATADAANASATPSAAAQTAPAAVPATAASVTVPAPKPTTSKPAAATASTAASATTNASAGSAPTAGSSSQTGHAATTPSATTTASATPATAPSVKPAHTVPTAAAPDAPSAAAPATTPTSQTAATASLGGAAPTTAAPAVTPTPAAASQAAAAPAAPPAPTAWTSAAAAMPHTMTVQVSPHGLGNMTARLDARGTQVTVSMTADSEAGRDALRNALPSLAEHLRTGDGAHVDVSLDSSADDRTGAESGSDRRPATQYGGTATGLADETPVAAAPVAVDSSRLLDLSL